MSTWRDKSVVIMGLGLHGGGVAAARWFARAGARVVVTDLKRAEDLRPSVKILAPYKKRITFVLGRHRMSDFQTADLIVQNPGVPRESPYLATARRCGIPIENEASLFVRFVGPARIVGITGTRGKSTTTAMVYDMVRQKYPRAIMAGNIRVPMFDVMARAQKTADPIILELSSWHLEVMGEHRLSPHIAVVTNVLPDHLNRYRTMRDYARAKEQIWRHQSAHDVVVLNKANLATRAMAPKVRGRVVWFDTQVNAPLKITGAHNRANAAAAIAVAKLLHVSTAAIRRALTHFSGLPGRIELVRTHQGVKWINDTTATTPDATHAALESIRGPVILIVGGMDKNLSYKKLSQEIARRCKAVILLPGNATNKIVKQFPISNFQFPIKSQFSNSKIVCVSSMSEAVKKACSLVQKGDTVLLSPAAASFGLFQHEFDRGDQFVNAVKRL